MYTKNKKYLTEILKDFKAGKITVEEGLQDIQNVIGEEIERKDPKKADLYAVEEESCPKV